MKKKLFLALVMAVAVALTLTIAVFADAVHNDSNVDYSEKVTLDDGTVLPLFDENKEALIWYLDSSNQLQSIRTDDERVKWHTETWNEVTSVSIVLDEKTTIGKAKFVVVNMMDDDVVKNSGGGTAHYGKPVTGFKFLFNYSSTLEYVYLRLDTTSIMKQSFTGCANLKYVNLESLTKLTRIGDNDNFSGCKSLFKGQILDLSKTSLKEIDWSNVFNGVPFIGIKLPSTVTRFGSHFENSGLISISFPANITTVGNNMFKNCVSLTTVCLNNKVTTIGDNAFYGCASLNTIFYVGSLDELNTLLDGVSTTGNDPFLAVVGEERANLISYADYQKLSDKSGKYMVYDYSWCEAYNDSNHETTPINACVGDCSVCKNLVVKHTEEENLSVKIEYTDYAKSGTRTVACNNTGCTHNVTEDTPALFTLLGNSVPESGSGSLAVGFIVNKAAVTAYVELTDKTFSYGLFVGSQSKLGNSDIIDKDGNTIGGIISVEMSRREFDIFELKIVGFESDELKSLKIAMGAYIVERGEDGTKISYLQDGTPNEGEKYYFASYNDIKKADTLN